MSYQNTSAQLDFSDGKVSDGPGERDPLQTLALDTELLPLAQEVAAACRRSEVRFEERALQEDYPGDDSKNCDDTEISTAAELQTDLELLQRILAALASRPQQRAALEAYCDYRLTDWASECVFDAATRSQLAAAIALFDAWDELVQHEPAEQLGSKARLLFCGGQPEAARSAAQDRLLKDPENLDALEAAADIFQDCGDLEGAERYARAYADVARRRGDFSDLRCALYTLSDVLSARGDDAAASAFDAEADALLPDEWEEEDDLDGEDGDSHLCPHCGELAHLQPLTLPVVRTQPKIGRNQPCPCGSGAKYKKCCGR